MEERDSLAPPFGGPPRPACYTCDFCGNPIAALIDDSYNICEYWPIKLSRKAFSDVPKPIASTASEAHLCLDAGSPRGAVALARAVVESVAKDKDITKSNLEGKIEALYKGGHISEAMKEAAHEIRFAGNEVAHGDLVTEPSTIEDAQEIVTLMDTILERVYHEPAKVTRIRQQRESRKAKPPSAEEDSLATHGDDDSNSDQPPF